MTLSITEERLRQIIRDVMLEVLSEFVSDPDEGLTLRPEVQVALREARQATQRKTYSGDEVAAMLGFDDGPLCYGLRAR